MEYVDDQIGQSVGQAETEAGRQAGSSFFGYLVRREEGGREEWSVRNVRWRKWTGRTNEVATRQPTIARMVS